MKLTHVALVLGLISSACAHKQVYRDTGAWSEAPEQGVGIFVRQVKTKKRKADVTFMVTNNYPFTVVIPENSVGFKYGYELGLTSNGNRRMMLRSKESTQMRVTYEFTDKPWGQKELGLNHIYKGEDTVEKGVSANSVGRGTATAYGNGNVVNAVSNTFTQTTAETYSKRGAVEGDRLPGVSVKFD